MDVCHMLSNSYPQTIPDAILNVARSAMVYMWLLSVTKAYNT